jgi:DNA-directed RNA polymerase specialized sigma24 family protein
VEPGPRPAGFAPDSAAQRRPAGSCSTIRAKWQSACPRACGNAAPPRDIFPIVALDAEADPEVAMDDARQPEPPDRALVRAQMRALLERQLDALPQAFRSVFVLRAVVVATVLEALRANP